MQTTVLFSSSNRRFPSTLAVAFVAALSACAPGATGSTDPAAQPATGAETTPAGSSTPKAATRQAGSHRRCGWIGGGDTAGAAAFVANAAWYDAIHPDWYALATDGTSLRTISGADDAALIAAAHANHVAVIPLVTAVEDMAPLRATFTDPARRAAHAKALVDMATTKGYDGFDLDYEKLWQPTDRAGYTALLEEIAAAMHAAGKQVSIAVPGVPDPAAKNGYDLESIVALVDDIHIMGYDFHTLGQHSGPLAPLGWIEAILKRIDATGAPEKFVLGLPNYGVTTSWFTTLSDALKLCGPSYATVDDHMATCGFGHYDSGRTPHCATEHGELYFEDLQSLEEKLKLAARYKVAGIGYWTVGSEPDGFHALIARYY